MTKWLVSAAAVIAVLVGAWFWQFGPSAQHGDQRPLRLGINPWPGYEFLYLAEVNGYFKEEGLNIELKQFSALEDVRNAFENHSIDGMCTTLVELLQAKANSGKQGRVTLVADYSNGADDIVASQSINSVQQLKGKKVGVEAKSLGVMMLARALQLNGMKPEDVDVLYLDQLSMETAFKAGTIDAAVSYPPKSIEMAKTGRRIFDSSKIPGEIIDVVSFDEATLSSHPGLQAALQRVWTKSLNFAKQNPVKAHAIMAKREGITPAEFADALNGLKLIDAAAQAAYFAPGGALERTIGFTIQTLQQSKDLMGDVGPAAQYIQR